MNPFQQFARGLYAARQELGESLTELLAFAEVLARKTNSIELDENGFFYVTASGPLEEVVSTMYVQLDKLERIKKQKETPT